MKVKVNEKELDVLDVAGRYSLVYMAWAYMYVLQMCLGVKKADEMPLLI